MYGHSLHLPLPPNMDLCLNTETPRQTSWTAEAMKYSLDVHFSVLADALSASHKHPKIDQECKV